MKKESNLLVRFLDRQIYRCIYILTRKKGGKYEANY